MMMEAAGGSPQTSPQMSQTASWRLRVNELRDSKQVRDVLKPGEFSGEHGDFPEFYEALSSFLATWQMDTLLKYAATREYPITIAEQCPEAREIGIVLYQLLRSLCKGTAKTMVRGITDSNSWEAIRVLYRYYVPDVGDRHVSVLQGLLNPTHWHEMPLHRFWASFVQWENDIVQYEHAAQDVVTSATRIAVVKKHVPEELKTPLQLADIGKDFVKCKDKLQSLVSSLISYDAAGVPVPRDELDDDPTPMEADALVKGKGKGKGKAKRKPAAQQQTLPQAPAWPSNNNCFRCNQPGHRAAECTEPLATDSYPGRCDFCEQYGHRQRQCSLWRKHKVMALKQVKRQGGEPSGAASGSADVTSFLEEDVSELIRSGLVSCDNTDEEAALYEYLLT